MVDMRVPIPLLLAALGLLAFGCSADEAQGLPVQGKVVIPEGMPPAQAEVVLQLATGRRLIAFPTPDGAFGFAEVPPGVHTLSVQLQGLLYPTVKLDVGASKKGRIAAMAADMPGTPDIPYPVLLRPFSRVEFFEKREGFNLWAFIKTPYGMMAAFMVFSIFIMPKLKIDPEEYREMMQDRGGGGDSQRQQQAQLQGQGRRRSD